jgi:hypothetical protein
MELDSAGHDMHAYATNFPWHPRLLLGMALLAIGISSAIGWVCAQVEGWWGIPVGGISSIAVFSILYFAFDRYLWRLQILRRFLLIPDLNGEWEVTARTVGKRGECVDWPWTGTITVAQSWSKICIALKTSQSASTSIAASLYREPPHGYRLIYHYDNKPNADQQEIHRHCGLCDILFDDGASEGSGQYFTDKDRLTAGRMALKKKGPTP